MNKSVTFTFIFEFLIFIACVLVFELLFNLSEESYVFLSAMFVLCWFFRFKRLDKVFEYYEHNLMVILLFLCVVSIVAISLRKVSSVFLVGGFSICTWFVITIITRYICLRIIGSPYTMLIHPDIMKELYHSHKVKLKPKGHVFPKDIHHADGIIFDRNFAYDADWKDLIFYASRHEVPLLTVRNYEELVEHRLSLSQLKEDWMQAGFIIPLRYRIFKNIIEYISILLLLPIVLLIMGIISLIIYLKMGRPVFFKQYRVGKNGEIFNIFKFRTMVVNAENFGPKMAVEVDKRVTSLGVFLRKSRLDELPQVFNILRCQMSIIGPRPEQVSFAEQFSKEIPLYRLRHLVRPGLTGWAQVRQGYTNDTDTTKLKLQYDLYYVKHFSLLLDIKILVKTIPVILTGKGAY